MDGPVPRVAVTAVGAVTALGGDPAAVARAVAEGRSGVAPDPALDGLPDPRSARVGRVDLRPWLRRRKDRKLMARAAELALAAAGPAAAAWPGSRDDLGLFLGVGREPPDTGEAEPALAAACRDGRLDEERLARAGRELYPPLLPLRTLPNMALAHVAMNLGVRGPNGAWAGGAAAALRAVELALWAVAEGRCPAALTGGADSLVDPGSARDRLRLGADGPPGEAAVVLLLEDLASALRRGAALLALLEPVGPGDPPPGPVVRVPRHRDALGDCGAADGAVALLLEIEAARATGRHRTVALADEGTPPVAVRVRAPRAC